VVATNEGIDDTLHTLNQFVDWFFAIRMGNKFTVSGYADKVGEAKNNLTLMEEAKQLGNHMAESLTEDA
jgi:outer membrane protein OmpA-like peptidoglycan-associated protein